MIWIETNLISGQGRLEDEKSKYKIYNCNSIQSV